MRIRSCRWRVAFAAAIAICSTGVPAHAQQKDSSAKADMRGMDQMHGMHDDSSMGMPIPMPKDMPMPPSYEGLLPPVGSFLPGEGVDPSTLPMV
jgi:hypothetical protein